MKTEEVDAVTGKTLKIVLKDDSQTLDEVVVVAVGYGNARKKDLTGAISSVGEKTLKTSQLLQLQAPLRDVWRV